MSSAAGAAATSSATGPGRRRWTLVAVCATTFMLLLDITIVVVALPSIQRRFGASLTGLQWLVDAYALTLSALILTAGALADRYGRRALFLVGVLLFTTASLLCGLAWSITALDLFRALQGVGGATLFATALALIGHEYRGPERFGALALWGATVGAAVASGPLVGGVLTDALGWRWIFFANVPVGLFALAVARRHVAESRDEAARHTDVYGLGSFSAALFLIVFAILRGNAGGWTSAPILAALSAGHALLLAFVAIERRQQRPMLDVTLFRQRAFVGVSLATFCIAAGMFALSPTSRSTSRTCSATRRSAPDLRFLPMTAFVFVVPLLTRRIAARLPPRVLIGAGLALVAGGLALMAEELSAGSRWTALLAGLLTAGIGIGAANPALAAAALRVVDPSRTGMASGINNSFRLGGVALGVAALGAVLENRVASSLSSTGDRIHGLAGAVSSAGLRAVAGHPALVQPARAAFVAGFHDLLLIGAAVLLAGALAGATLLRAPAATPEPVTEPA